MRVLEADALLDKTFVDYQREGHGGMSITEREQHNAVRLGARQFANEIIRHVPDSSKRGDVIRAIRDAQKIADKVIEAAHK